MLHGANPTAKAAGNSSYGTLDGHQTVYDNVYDEVVTLRAAAPAPGAYETTVTTTSKCAV